MWWEYNVYFDWQISNKYKGTVSDIGLNSNSYWNFIITLLSWNFKGEIENMHWNQINYYNKCKQVNYSSVMTPFF